MIFNLEGANYLMRAIQKLEDGSLQPEDTSSRCYECDWSFEDGVLNFPQLDAHTLWRNEHRRVVIIGCEGYWQIDPALIGLDRPEWRPPHGEGEQVL